MNYMISVITGALLSLMLFLNGTISEIAGNYTATTIIHLTGLIGMIILLIVNKASIKKVKGLPLYVYSAGLIGIITVLFNNLTYSYIGASLTIALGLVGQSIMAVVVDHYGWFDLPIIAFNKKKIIGFVVISIGIFIMTLN